MASGGGDAIDMIPGAVVEKIWYSLTPAQTLDVKQVALFKNGLGFFVAETTCPAGRTEFSVTLPAAPSQPGERPAVSIVRVRKGDIAYAVEAAIDLLGGRVVRLAKGAYDAVTEYGDDPVAVARVTGQPYPNLAQAWKSVLFNQFHDILAGTSLEIAYEDARNSYGEALAVARIPSCGAAS